MDDGQIAGFAVQPAYATQVSGQYVFVNGRLAYRGGGEPAVLARAGRMLNRGEPGRFERG